MAEQPSLQTEWWFFFVRNYEIPLNGLLIKIKGAAQSVCRLYMNIGATIHNNTMYAVKTKRLRKFKAYK